MIRIPICWQLLAAASAVLALALAALAGASGAQPNGDRVSARTAIRTAAFPAVSAGETATWCGTPSAVDARPNAVAGQPVHWVYVYPLDGEDRFSTFASAMQTDVETIDAWWRGQDPTRAPRSDLTQFACGVQLDLSSVRLQLSGSQLGAPDAPFDLIWDALLVAGFDSDYAKYVVYYDGPIGNENICGAGATAPRSLGMAMVFVRSCPGVTSAEVAAHELVHTMGAVPNGAPHMCPPPDDGHTCDNDRDLMYPFSDGTPLTGLALDPDRDDYYGHAGSWTDIQDSPWLVQLDRQAPLTLTVSGPGSVVADVPGLECSQSCTTTWNSGTRLVLTPTPGQGAKLVRWSGACSGAALCAVTVGAGSAATAFFAPASYRLSLRVSGRGSVRNSSSGIPCRARCATQVPSHSQLRLTATPAKGWKLKTWTGACHGKRLVCTLPMTASTSARAVFARA